MEQYLYFSKLELSQSRAEEYKEMPEMRSSLTRYFFVSKTTFRCK